jgi:hypothetical protein
LSWSGSPQIAAQVQPGERVLVRHAARQVEHVGQRGLFARVRVEAGAAERGAQRGGVDADDRAEAGLCVLAEHDLLVAGGGRVVEAGENAHG